MKLSDFDFDLPDHLIATRPVFPRHSSKMLVAQNGEIFDRSFVDIIDALTAGDRLVLNNTKVIPARLFGHRTRDSSQGVVEAKIEVTLLEPETDGRWRALIKPLRKLHIGETVEFGPDFSAECISKEDGEAVLSFNVTGDDLDAALHTYGKMPLPPYIASKRAADDQDASDYQTIWAEHKGAVAAPTASLHFDAFVMDALRAKGVEITYVTLHVGAGTFLPVKVEDVTTHKMHSEWGHVTQDAVEEINATREAGGRVVAVGTTALRLIETASRTGELQPWEGPTDIFIYPGFEFQVTDALITNFHLPKSTLLMLVSAFMGRETMTDIYNHAIAQHYRFFSYGDASLLIRK